MFLREKLLRTCVGCAESVLATFMQGAHYRHAAFKLSISLTPLISSNKQDYYFFHFLPPVNFFTRLLKISIQKVRHLIAVYIS
jgi:hypothetical protein